jgi:hypothetical protein
MHQRFAAFLLVSAGSIAAQTCPETRTVRVEVPVAAKVDSRSVATAQREAEWILRSLCATVEWGPGGLLVRILPAPLTTDSTADAMGMAMPQLGRGAIFLSRISEQVTTAVGRVSLPTLLGCVLAHEIGHLVLGSAHTKDSVMSANFGKRELEYARQRHLVFNAAERKLFASGKLSLADRATVEAGLVRQEKK